MRNRFRYRPGMWERLEDRLTLTHGGPITPALIGTLSPNPQASGPLGRIQAQVNGSFDRFTTDYLQAQSAYLSSGSGTDAFKAFVFERIDLLSQELTRTLSRVPGSLAHIPQKNQQARTDSSVVLQAFLRTRINGPMLSTSLLNALTSPANLPPANASGATATLYTLTATSAIEAARVATINAIKFLVFNSFSNKKR